MRMGGEEMVVTVYLAVFAISVAIGSGLGAFFCAGRIVLLPAPAATLVLAFFSAELALALHSLPAAAAQIAVGDFFKQPAAWRVGFDLAAMAVAGGVLAVPSFAAAQAWAPAEKRARVVAAINVLNAAFMVAGTLAVAALQKAGLGLDGVFALMALAALIAAAWMFARLPTSPMRDFLSILFRAFYRLEVKGRDNIAKAGPNAIIALNHVSFLDAALALSLLDHDPIFAIDTGIAERWWVKPFLRFVRVYPLDPTKPMATRGLIHAVRDGETLVIFPEGRLTVTGSLMKVYDGAGMIADKSGRKIVPTRIDGLEASAFSRLSRDQAPRRFLNKVTVTILEPVELEVGESLIGKARRQAAGAALYQIMSDLLFRTTDVEKTLFAAVAQAARKHGMGRVALEDPTSPALTYRKLLIGARLLGKQFSRLGPVGQPIGLMLPNVNGAGAAFLGLLSANRPPAMINFTAGPANIAAACAAAEAEIIVTSRAFIEKARAGKTGRTRRGKRRLRLSRGFARQDFRSRQAARLPQLPRAPREGEARRSRRHPFHFRIGGRAQGRRPLPPQYSVQCRASRRPHRFRPQRPAVQRAADLPFLRADRRPRPAAGFRRPDLSLSVAVALPHHPRADLRQQRHDPVRHRHCAQRLCAFGPSLRFALACVMSSPAPRR